MRVSQEETAAAAAAREKAAAAKEAAEKAAQQAAAGKLAAKLAAAAALLGGGKPRKNMTLADKLDEMSGLDAVLGQYCVTRVCAPPLCARCPPHMMFAPPPLCARCGLFASMYFACVE